MLGRFLIPFMFFSFFPLIIYYALHDFNIISLILLLLPSIVDFVLDEIFFYRRECRAIRTPENMEIVEDYLRNNNILIVGYVDPHHATKKMPIKMFKMFLHNANIFRPVHVTEENTTKKTVNIILKCYKPANIKDFNNINIFENKTSYKVVSLKSPPENGSPVVNLDKDITINKKDIISDLHLYYLLTIIDTSIGE